MLTRNEFKEYLHTIVKDNIDSDDCPVWIPEKIVAGEKSQWFIKVVIDRINFNLSDFLAECNSNMSGIFRCYIASDDHSEWWGFTNKDDVVWFSMRWNK